MPIGWALARMLFALCLLKLVAASLTIGSGGSAGDFAPSLVIGGLFGGAFGEVMRLMLQDPAIDPGAFALVGMAAFYAGIARVPLAALVMVSELAGGYDLLVPLMLAIGISYLVLRKRGLHAAQPATRRDSPQHRQAMILDVLEGVEVGTHMEPLGDALLLAASTSVGEVLRRAAASTQEVFPVLDDAGRLAGILSPEAMRRLSAVPSAPEALARDVMLPPVRVRSDESLRTAITLLLEHHLRELPVTDGDERVIGFIDEAEISQSYLDATAGETRVSG
jgi:CIC family chloride channel protein